MDERDQLRSEVKRTRKVEKKMKNKIGELTGTANLYATCCFDMLAVCQSSSVEV